MKKEQSKIFLNDILNLGNLDNVKIRFNLMFEGNWNPIEIFKDGNTDILLSGQYWNYQRKKSFKEGQVTVGFIRLGKDNLWLLFHVGRITKDLNKLNAVGYEYEALSEFEKYFGRLIVKFKNKSQTMIRLAKSVIDECEVVQILPDIFDNDIFPGYDHVNISWEEMSRVLTKEGWKTALKNQKGVYLITDSSNGKMYVGSAYGDQMLLGRWGTYINTGHGGNIELKGLSFEHIKNNFRYSILDIFKSTINDQVIIARENWWKCVLHTREFGYNKN
ncbi:GIY-YIG nuclease family protein [Halomicronema sp. CCY15110]|uniref:GIY-YIG nuclease family protein n=1 Tax=Halomicronema sp. CCY15110 TaxID=2767773 RepID=UPI00195185DF|nr:GIY-YIG nuclease family protein [Halomicronema sp. CCY15110]